MQESDLILDDANYKYNPKICNITLKLNNTDKGIQYGFVGEVFQVVTKLMVSYEKFHLIHLLYKKKIFTHERSK